MEKKTDNDAAESAASDLAKASDGQENVDKIRDILFGGQMRDYDHRFHQLEDRILKENTRLGSDLTARLDQLDNFVRNEFKLLGDKLTSERKERQQDDEDIKGNFTEARKTIENRIADTDEVHSSAEQEIRGRIHEQGTEVLAMIRQNQEQLQGSIRDESRRLGTEKVAREDLADLFTEVAMRLQRDMDIPGDS